ncbi:M56 family metallopeptidase [Blautia sp.]|uniref:M56 family metallopeptidase n=1 Tax=Blautia sp. TaxID=1955243 RepID=UPI0025843EA2|nr:M56 family metallopeptidase [Blautia sp.]
MFFSTSSLLSVVFLCSLLVIFIWFYLRDIDRMVQIGIRSIFIVIGFIVIRLIFPFEFTFSDSFAVKYLMPNIFGILRTPVIFALNRTFSILDIGFFIWVVGIIITAASTITTRLHFGRVVKQLPILSDSKINKVLHTIAQDYKKPISFQVIASNIISTPMLYGFRCPKIIVPIVDLTYEEWYFILKHETSHFYNRDLQIKMFIQLLRIIYWWNPFVYLLNVEIDKMLEFRADSEVTKTLSEYEKTKYLECLLKVAKSLSLDKHNYYSVAFDSGKTSVLSQRFHLIHGSYKYSNNKRLSAILMVIPLILLSYLSFTAVFEPYAISPSHAANTVELTEDSSYLILNSKGEYDVYINNSFFATVREIKDSYSNLKVYNNLEEAKKYENKK